MTKISPIFDCKVRILLILIYCLFPSIEQIHAQQYSVVNYRWEHGFSATTGYAVTQDYNGYIWISTENGLMRFNGYDFKVYTTRDGLPDNEILGLYQDRTSRLWLLPFANNLAYIKNGKVHTSANDRTLHSLNLKTKPDQICFDKHGGIWVFESGIFTILNSNGSVQKIKELSGMPLINKTTKIWLDRRDEIMCLYGKDIYKWDGHKFIESGGLPFEPCGKLYCDSTIFYDPTEGIIIQTTVEKARIESSLMTHITKIRNVHEILRINENELIVTSDDGASIIDIAKGKFTATFLKGIKIGAILRAKDESLWFGTIGNGIFRFFPTAVKTIEAITGSSSIIYIKGGLNSVRGTTDNAVYVEATSKGKDCTKINIAIEKDTKYVHYLYAGRSKNGRWIDCGDNIYLRRSPGGRPIKKYTWLTKAVLEEDAEHLLIGTTIGIIRLDKSRFVIEDTFMFNQRILSLAKIGDVIYAGKLNGLFACKQNKSYYQVGMGNHLLETRITALCTVKGSTLWVANGNAELIALQWDKVKTVIGLQNGLQCNRISCIKASKHFIWVGTDNGLFAISQLYPYKIVRHITYTNGLGSNQINCLDIHDDMVWIGTINGINYFNEKQLFQQRAKTTIIINSIVNGDSILVPDKGQLHLVDKTLSIDFDVVDFSGGTKPFFQYSIGKGKWLPIEGNHLNFPTIPNGAFVLRIQAFSPNWSGGTIFEQSFYKRPPFYQNIWFIIPLTVIILLSLFLILWYFLKDARKKDRQKIAVRQNLLLLEQMALQSQLNPHFIFNCIAAIKQYYSSGALVKADKFIDDFSALIRQTFEMGSEIFATLDKELNYLTQYLNVEKARFNNSFQYHISSNINSPESSVDVPVMLLQPVVENALRHGIRHLPNGHGTINIEVIQQEGNITFIIEDNGIGRKRSSEINGSLHGQKLNSSKVNEKRVNILNQLSFNCIKMYYEDITEDSIYGTGTRVTISYPLNIKTIIKNEGDYN